jgi:hypothetical protein
MILLPHVSPRPVNGFVTAGDLFASDPGSPGFSAKR